jgi:membrane protein YqaA with SNARE-associated domain
MAASCQPEPAPAAAALPTDGAGPETVELRPHGTVALRLRDWFIPYALVLAAATAIYLTTCHDTAAGGLVQYLKTGLETTTGRLALLFGYLSLACTFLPLPTWPIIILAAGPDLGLPPLLVATIGALATATANMHDYYIVTALYRLHSVRRVRTNRWYVASARWYNRAPFGTLAAASFLPIPIDVVRLLAISEGYPRLRFALGSIVGRWPRYFLVAYLANEFKLGWQWAVGVLGAMVALGLARGLPPLVRKISQKVRTNRAK